MTSSTAPSGARRFGRLTVPTVTLALAAGALAGVPAATASTHSANAASTFQAWGSNSQHQTELPFDLRSGLKVINKISLGDAHGVAATSDKKLYAWGADEDGEGSVPANLANLGTIDVAAGDSFNVVLGDDGNPRVWGDMSSGVGNVPQAAVDATLTQVAAGTDHALALGSNGKVYAWGNPSRGQTIPPFALALRTTVAIAAGDGYSMALTNDGKVVAWGDNSLGQTSVPSSLNGVKVKQIAAGDHHALALTEDGQVVAWGDNSQGALNVPALAPDDSWIQVTAGDGFSSGVAAKSGTAGVWGRAAAGILSPPVPSGSFPVSVAAGGNFLVQGFRRLGVAKAPTITGTGKMGQQLFTTHAVFGPADGGTKTGSWITVGSGVVVGTGQSYTPKPSDVGNFLVFRTTVVNSQYGEAFADSSPLLITKAPFVSATVPTITGTAQVGSTLTGKIDTVPAADSYRYDWYANGIFRSTSDAKAQYVVQPADLGKKITLIAYGDKDGYERINAGESVPTATVEAVPVEVLNLTMGPQISGTARVGQVLSAWGAATIPEAESVSYQWRRDGSSISGATGSTYRLARADSGRQISVVATMAKNGFEPVSAVSVKPVKPAAAVSKVVWQAKQLTRKGAKRSVKVTIAVSASGVSGLAGSVTLRDGAKVLRTVAVKNGKAVITVKLAKGKHLLKATYNGTAGVGGVSLARRMAVR